MPTTPKATILENHWKAIARYPDFVWIKKLKKERPEAEVYLVGGAVRDILLKKKNIVDYDFTIRNITQKQLETFLKKQGTVNLVGKAFGVNKFVHKNAKLPQEVDITFPRKEKKTGVRGKYRDFIADWDPTLPIEDDLGRRDFSINSIAWNVLSGKIVDPYKGTQDLEMGVIDTVGDPAVRFAEDYSRLLRGLRFAVTFGFTIKPRVSQALKNNLKRLNDMHGDEYVVSREVVAKEIVKTFIVNPVAAFGIYDTFGVFQKLIPELLTMKKCPQPKQFHTEGDVWEHTRLALSKIGDAQFKKLFPKQAVTPLLIFATLFHDIGKPATLQTPKKDGVDRVRNNNHDYVGAKMVEEISKRIPFSNYGDPILNSGNLSWLIKKHLLLVHGPVEQIKNSTLEKYFFNDARPGKTLLQLFYTDGAATIPKDGNNLNALKKLLKRLKKLEPLVFTKTQTKKRGLITGNDLIKELGIKQGPRIGDLLSEIREAELSGTITTKRQALTFAKKLHTK